MSAIDLEQSTGWAIWKISSPVVLSSMLFTFQTTVDMFWVGRLGKLDLAAVSLAGSLLGVFQTMAGLISAGTLATCARFAGADNRRGVQESLFHSLLLSAVLAEVVAVVTVPFSRELLNIFGAETRVVELGAPFLRILLIALVLQFPGVALASVFQALGDTRTPMWIAIVANAVNLVLDPFLIFGWVGLPRLGIVGAAIATAASQLIALAMLLGLLQRRGLVVLRQPIRLHIFKTLLRIGTPASLTAITRPLTGMLLFRILTSFGSAAVAAFGVGLRILNIMYIYLQGLGSACQSLVGQNLGAGRPEGAERVARRVQVIAVSLQLVVLTVLFVLAPGVVRIFNRDADIVRYGVSYLRVLSPFLVLLGLSNAWSGTQYGAGDTRPTAVAALIANWLVKIPLAYILSRMIALGIVGVWLGIGISVVIETVILGITYYRGGWRHREIVWHS